MKSVCHISFQASLPSRSSSEKGWRDEFAFGFDLFNNVGPYCSAYRSISRLIATLATHLLQSREPLVESLAQSFGLDADFVE